MITKVAYRADAIILCFACVRVCLSAAAAAAAAPLGPARFCLCGSRRVCVRATTARREWMNARPREGDANEVSVCARASRWVGVKLVGEEN